MGYFRDLMAGFLQNYAWLFLSKVVISFQY